MNAHALPALAGWHWLTGGYRLYRRNPAQLFLAAVSYWALVFLLNLIPLLGPIIASLAMPAFSVGVMNACRQIDEGRTLPPGIIFSGFAANRNTLFLLGGLYLLLSLGLVFSSSLLDGGDMLRFLMTGQVPERSTSNLAWLTPFLLLALYLPVFMAYWYAPLLAAWHRLPMLKSLFFSLVACWRNVPAFLAYGLALAVLVAALPGAVLLLVSILAPQALSLAFGLISIPLTILVMPVVFASFYLSYRDVFRLPEHA